MTVCPYRIDITDLVYYAGPEITSKIKEIETNLEKKDIYDFLNEAFKKDGEDSGLEGSQQSDDSDRSQLIARSDCKDFGEGIITKRLIGDNFHDIELLDFAEEDRKQKEEFELENSVFKKNLDLLNEFEDEASNKKRHEIIKESINNVKELGVIRLFKIVSFFWVGIVIALVSL